MHDSEAWRRLAQATLDAAGPLSPSNLAELRSHIAALARSSDRSYTEVRRAVLNDVLERWNNTGLPPELRLVPQQVLESWVEAALPALGEDPT